MSNETIIGEDMTSAEMRGSLLNEFQSMVKIKENMLWQKARLWWIKEGDLNSRYFYSCLRIRTSINKLEAINTDQSWVHEVDEV